MSSSEGGIGAPVDPGFGGGDPGGAGPSELAAIIQTADGLVTNTIVEGSLTSGIPPIPANRIGPGTALLVRCAGILSTNIGAALDFRFKIDGVTLDSGVFTL